MADCCFGFNSKLWDFSDSICGSWYSTVDQINTIGGVLPMTINGTDFENGVAMVDNSKITIAKSGKYNIQFSAQVKHRGGGGNGKNIDIWFAKNGNNISNSNTKIDIDTNTPYNVIAWNYFVSANENDFFQIMWTTANASIVFEHENIGVVHPETPSIIITINKI